MNVRSWPQHAHVPRTLSVPSLPLLSAFLSLSLHWIVYWNGTRRQPIKRTKANAMICVSHAVQFVTILTLITI